MTTLATSLITAAGLAAALGSAACSKRAEAQAASDPLGPIRCYQAMGSRFATQTMRQLCAGAPSDAPARCVTAALADNQLSESQALALCWGATTTEPAECAATASADGKLTNQTIINSCASRSGFSATTDLDACVAAGRSELRLSDVELVELCARGASTVNNF